jgi:cytochrome c biogenesis protein CcmG/thiol:disulfide interchange protein DsbE
MKINNSLSALAVPLILLAWIWVSRIPPSALPSSAIEAPKENFLAPDFRLISIDDSEIILSELKGQPIILNFWASWCPPCRAEMPAFQEAWQEYSDTDLVILAVNATHQDSLLAVEKFIDQYHLNFPILLDKSGSVSSAYQIHSLPTTFVINREGVIITELIGGPLPLSLLRVQADQLLQEEINVPGY